MDSIVFSTFIYFRTVPSIVTYYTENQLSKDRFCCAGYILNYWVTVLKFRFEGQCYCTTIISSGPRCRYNCQVTSPAIKHTGGSGVLKCGLSFIHQLTTCCFSDRGQLILYGVCSSSYIYEEDKRLLKNVTAKNFLNHVSCKESWSAIFWQFVKHKFISSQQREQVK